MCFYKRLYIFIILAILSSRFKRKILAGTAKKRTCCSISTDPGLGPNLKKKFKTLFEIRRYCRRTWHFPGNSMGRFFTVEMEIINCDGKEPLIKVVDDFSCQLRIQFFSSVGVFKKVRFLKRNKSFGTRGGVSPGSGLKVGLRQNKAQAKFSTSRNLQKAQVQNHR